MGRLHRRPIFLYGDSADTRTLKRALYGETQTALAQGEGELDRDQDRDGLAESGPWLEPPLLGGLDRLLIETERRVERPHDVNASNRSVCKDNALEQDGALHLGAHRVCGVLRLDLAKRSGD